MKRPKWMARWHVRWFDVIMLIVFAGLLYVALPDMYAWVMWDSVVDF